jgi:type I restriction enzyme S subunit
MQSSPEQQQTKSVNGCWKTAPLEDCMEAIIDYRGKTPEKKTFGVPLITAKVIKGGRIEPTEEFIAESDYESWMRRGMPKRGDVVMTTEAPLGEVAQLDGSKIALAQRVITLRGKPELLDNTFLKFLMQSDEVQEELRSRATGTTVLGIRQSELRQVSLTLPPLAEQKRIAEVLGALDDKIELNRRMNSTLGATARALFQSWFVDFDPVRAKLDLPVGQTGGRTPSGIDPATTAFFPDSFEESPLGHIPKGWEVKPVGEVVDCVGGGTPSTSEPKYWEGGTHHWTTPKDFSSLQAPILLDTERRVTDAGVAKISSGLLPAGTLLMSSRAPVGYLAISAISVAINQGFIAMKCNERASNYFMLNWCQQNMADIEGRATGTTFAEISKQNFRPIPLVLPTQVIMTAFSERVASFYAQITANLRQSRTLATLRDTLLPKLLSGELSVREAASEVDDHVPST